MHPNSWNPLGRGPRTPCARELAPFQISEHENLKIKLNNNNNNTNLWEPAAQLGIAILAVAASWIWSRA